MRSPTGALALCAWVAVAAVGVGVSGCPLGDGAMIGPGAGGTTEVRYVPHPGTPVRLQLDVSVWGAGGEAASRYRNVRLRYTISGASPGQMVEGRLISKDAQRLRYEFEIHPYPGGSSGTLDYEFEMVFDGEARHIAGKQQIDVPASPP